MGLLRQSADSDGVAALVGQDVTRQEADALRIGQLFERDRGVDAVFEQFFCMADLRFGAFEHRIGIYAVGFQQGFIIALLAQHLNKRLRLFAEDAL